MRVAVTGSSGFVGRHVVAGLESRSVPTVAVQHSYRHGRESSVAAGDVRIDLHALPPDPFRLMGSPQVLVHLAWAGLDDYRSALHVERELPAHIEFLKNMVEAGVEHVVVAGTCLEYGMQPGPLDETMEAKPILPYAFAKDALRQELERLKRNQSFRLTWPRLFYLYGEGQSRGSLFPQLQQAVARGDKEFDLSGGEQLRDYLPVAEAARLLVSLALGQQDTGIVNLCSGQPISVRRLTEGWVGEFAWPIKLNFGRHPYNDYEPMAFWGVRSKLDRSLAAL